MSLPITFATLAGGNQPLSLFDTQFAAVAALGIIPCAASGQNAVILTPNANTPTLSSYTDLAPSFIFVAAQTSNGPVTINAAGLGSRNAYAENGSIQIGTLGTQLIAGNVYVATPLQALNAGVGGFVINAESAVNPISLGLSGVNIAARFGSLDVWQRGAGGSASIAVPASTTLYTADGWYLGPGANQACTVAAVAGIAPGSFKAASVTRNNGQTGTGFIVFGAPLDSDEIALIAGQFVTISFTASTGANWSPTNGTLNFLVPCGTGVPKKNNTGYTGQTTPISTSVNISAGSTAARYQATSAVIIPANTTQAEVQFNWQPTGTAGAADTVTIDDVQLEVVPTSSSVASTYERRDFNDQLRRCLRHFWKTFSYGTAPAQNVGATTGELHFIAGKAGAATEFGPVRYPVQMRATPVTASFNPSAANAQVRDETAALDCSSTATSQSTAETVTISATGNAGTSVGNILGVHLTADAGI